MTTNSKKIVLLGTGGTIAGRAASAADNLAYNAAQVGIDQLAMGLSARTGIAGISLETEQVAQLDSKDMDWAIWLRLAERVERHLGRDDVQGIVITHGTDTLEETAYFLHRVVPASRLHKPVVLTCAMRPASSASPDGPQNLGDAVAVAGSAHASGVVVVCAGTIHAAQYVQKVHTYRLDAFDSGDAGVLGYVEEARPRMVKDWPKTGENRAWIAIKKIAMEKTPRVEILTSCAATSGATVDALLAVNHGLAPPDRLQGLVVAGTGNGTLHHALGAALLRAQGTGIRIVRATRCAYGLVMARPDDVFPDSQGLSPVKARIELMLELAQQRPTSPAQSEPGR